MKVSRKFALLLAGCLALSGLQAAAPKPFLDDPLPVQAWDDTERPTLGDPNGKIVTIGEIQYKIITEKIDGKSVKHARVYQLTYPRDNRSQYIVPEDTELKGEVVIPSTVQGVPVTKIYYGAFRGCSQITSVVLPETMEWIGDRAFCDCTGLTSVHLNEGLKMIEGCAFQNCALTSVVIPPNVEMYESVFSGCTDLEKVTFENRDWNMYVPPYCFSNCTSLKEVNLGVHRGLEIERYAFSGCSALEELTIPPNTGNIGVMLGRCLFRGCESLKTVTILAEVSGLGGRAVFMAEKLKWDELGEEILSVISYVKGVTVRGIPGTKLETVCKKSKVKFEPLTESELELIAATTTTVTTSTTTATTTTTTATTTSTTATTTATTTGELPAPEYPDVTGAQTDDSQCTHSPAEAVIENRTEPDYDAEGSYDSVVYCAACGEELSRETIILPKLELTEVIIRSYDINGFISETTVYAETYKKGDFTLPSPPAYVEGLEFAGWIVNGHFYYGTDYEAEDAVQTVIADLVAEKPRKPISVAANNYLQTGGRFKVTVVNGILMSGAVDVKSGDSYRAHTELYVTAARAKEGLRFDHWESNGEIASYNEVYAFHVPSKDITITAVYSSAETEIEKVGTAYIESVIPLDGNRIAFTSKLSVPEGATMLKGGIVANTEAELNGAELTEDTAMFSRYDDKKCRKYLTYKFTWSKNDVSESDVWCVRAYLVYSDENGDEHTVYGDLVRADLNGMLT